VDGRTDGQMDGQTGIKPIVPSGYTGRGLIIQKANTKSSVGQHGPPTNAKVGSGAAEE
jgi:hypothetical protein